MKIILILSLLFISTFAYIEKCPNCTEGAVESECRCKAFKKSVELTNGTTLYCCGEKINTKCAGFWDFLKWMMMERYRDRDYDYEEERPREKKKSSTTTTLGPEVKNTETEIVQ